MAYHIKPNKKDSETKCIRFPLPLVEKIEEAIVGKDVSFSRFIIQACEYALSELDTSDSANNKKAKKK